MGAASCIQLLIVAVSQEALPEQIAPFSFILPGVLSIISIYMALVYYDFIYPLVTLWAVAAIQANSDEAAIVLTADIIIGLMVLTSLLALVRYLNTGLINKSQLQNANNKTEPLLG
jgi:hypothetical protein